MLLRPRPAASAPPPAPPPPPPPSRRKTAALVAGGVGVVGLGVGAVAGVIAWNRKGTIDEECAGGLCSQRGLGAVDATRSAARVSDIGFVVGAVGVAAGAVLWLTAPGPAALASAPAPRPKMRRGAGWAPRGDSEPAISD